MKAAANAKERVQYGKSRRDVLSRASVANLHPKQRQFLPVDVLRASTEGRVPQLLPVKYGRMKLSPFAFFRGAVSIMAADLGRLPNSGLHAQLCGDAHVQNLGSFATPDGKLVFDLNDFDETIRGPWEWDVKRMAASIVLAGQLVRSRPLGMQGRCRGVRRKLLPVDWRVFAAADPTGGTAPSPPREAHSTYQRGATSIGASTTARSSEEVYGGRRKGRAPLSRFAARILARSRTESEGGSGRT